MDDGIGRLRNITQFAGLPSLPAPEIIGLVREGGRTINEEPMALRVGVERQPRARSFYQAGSKQRISQHGRANASHGLTARRRAADRRHRTPDSPLAAPAPALSASFRASPVQAPAQRSLRAAAGCA